MKTVLVAFEYKGCTENAPIDITTELLKSRSIYVDNKISLSPFDKQTFLAVLSQKNFDSVFIVNTSLSEFSVVEALKEIGIEIDGDGYYLGNCFVALSKTVPDNIVIDKQIACLQNYFKKYLSTITFKLFGVELKQINAVTDRICQVDSRVYFQSKQVNLDSTVVMFYDSETPKTTVDKIAREFLLTFKESVYANEDVTLEKRLNDLLRLRRRVIATAESMTGGAIASRIISISGASNVFYEGFITYATESKEERLGVEHSSVIKNSVVSSQVAYEMAKGLMLNTKVNCAISITGYAEPNEQTPVGICYIGVGVDNVIDVVKYVLKGSRQEAIITATNAALFLMIKAI